MKKFITKSVIFIIGFLATQTWGANNMVQCNYEPGDISPIRTFASSKHDARKKASHICFEKRMALLESRGLPIDEDQELMTIDSCVNICD